jgi:Protein of unknown function (DUF3106)
MAGQYATTVAAQTAMPPATPTTPVKPVSPVKPVPAVVTPPKVQAKPLWAELTPVQQQSLKPLAANWSTIGEAQKRKWLEISKNYQSLPAAEQTKMHSRMAEWVSLSQQQRAQARLNFAEVKTLTPSDKTANWQAYQALSAEEKQKLANQAQAKPHSAAVAVKPVAPHKLATVPVTRKTGKETDHMASNAHVVNQNTLLPLPATSTEPASVQRN